jgi:hypothetical protein
MRRITDPLHDNEPSTMNQEDAARTYRTVDRTQTLQERLMVRLVFRQSCRHYKAITWNRTGHTTLNYLGSGSRVTPQTPCGFLKGSCVREVVTSQSWQFQQFELHKIAMLAFNLIIILLQLRCLSRSTTSTGRHNWNPRQTKTHDEDERGISMIRCCSIIAW